jgi:phenylacetate-CoA ligase
VNELLSKVERLLLDAFHRAASHVPGYRALLKEEGVDPDQIKDMQTFLEFCPLLTKHNTFNRYPLQDLCVGGSLHDVAEVLTSSGHGGNFSFGIKNRKQLAASARFIDGALDAAFQVKSRSTLAVNCLPMGVGFSSECMTIATTSVREDMAVALVKTFGQHYDQIILVGDPLFMKKLVDYSASQHMDWTSRRINVVLGEEIFGEHFRNYLSKCFGLSAEKPEKGYILSSMGTGELGLHLCHETPSTIALRRAAHKNPELARELLGVHGPGRVLPMIFAFDPARTLIEIIEPDRSGYGNIAVSILDLNALVPLLRYQTGDIGRLLDGKTASEIFRHHSLSLPDGLPDNLIVLKGRQKEALPNGAHVGFYKDALYADPGVAANLTGALRLIFSGREFTMHVQLTRTGVLEPDLRQGILQAIPSAIQPRHLVVWPYDRYPFGMSLDYERKFSYYIPGEVAPCGNNPGIAAVDASPAGAASCQDCPVALQMQPA